MSAKPLLIIDPKRLTRHEAAVLRLLGFRVPRRRPTKGRSR